MLGEDSTCSASDSSLSLLMMLFSFSRRGCTRGLPFVSSGCGCLRGKAGIRLEPLLTELEEGKQMEESEWKQAWT